MLRNSFGLAENTWNIFYARRETLSLTSASMASSVVRLRCEECVPKSDLIRFDNACINDETYLLEISRKFMYIKGVI